jgi:serine protease AprX
VVQRYGNELAAVLKFPGPSMTRRVLALVCAVLTGVGLARASEPSAESSLVASAIHHKLDRALVWRLNAVNALDGAAASTGRTRIIIRTADGRPATRLIESVGGLPGRYFPWLGGQVAIVPDAALDRLARRSDVVSLSLDRPVRGTMERTTTATGSKWVAEHLGVTGAGIGVATIDSGVNPWHDDLDGRILQFADFVNGQAAAYDDYGHGTHVAGIIAGSGQSSNGVRRGMAPGAHLVVLKALDITGNGFTSNVIAAIDYAIANRAAFNIRVLNLSVAAGVYESFTKDPLTLAAKRAVDSGIVVVAAAGNRGRDQAGQPQYGAIASPGNAPWVLTVGASNDAGTADRRDDVVAAFSSRGPSPIDENAKPDLIAPGVNVESTADPTSALFAANPSSRLWGTAKTGTEPYLSLTGTSMASPVVAGAIALMLEANASLTPNAVKAILEFTAEARDGYNNLTQGAGFLNARGAVELARAFAGAAIAPELSGDPVRWSRQIIWGNRRLAGGMLGARANAWKLGVTWGDARTASGEPIGWGIACRGDSGNCDPTPWVIPASCTASPTDCDREESALRSFLPDGVLSSQSLPPEGGSHRDKSEYPTWLPPSGGSSESKRRSA